MVLTHIPLGDDTEDPVEGGKKGKGSKIVPKRHLAVHVPIARLHALSGGGGWGRHTMNTPGQSAK